VAVVVAGSAVGAGEGVWPSPRQAKEEAVASRKTEAARAPVIERAVRVTGMSSGHSLTVAPIGRQSATIEPTYRKEWPRLTMLEWVARPATALVMAALLVVSVAAACDGGGSGGDDDVTPGDRPPPAISVVTTLPFFAEMLQEIGGDRVEVTAMLPDGVDPTIRELTEEQLEVVTTADAVLYNGLNLETTMEDLLFEHKRTGSLIVTYAIDVPSPTKEGMSAARALDNPYLWLDPVLAQTYSDTTWDSLLIRDAEGSAIYNENHEVYEDKLEALHEQMQETLATIPAENRKLVAAKDTFFHLANRYDLEPVTLTPLLSTDEPSPRRVEDLVALIRELDVPAVFAERGYESELLKDAARSARVELCFLYSDAPDEEARTYIEMMTYNAEELARCLAG
jgi:ABC-type Zn uptake system ZnuABC Zn-binding protein ZnuA